MPKSTLKKNIEKLTSEESSDLLKTLEERFRKNPTRHPDLEWHQVEVRLLDNADKLWSLQEMERTGGEPDAVGGLMENGTIEIYDCARETPKERRNLCYDNEALAARKANKPANSAVGMAAEMGIELTTEEEYRKLQDIMKLDEKTSSWVVTPSSIRKLGGALFCDRRFDTVFTYHNGAESYYGSRGFRGKLVI